MLQRLGLHLQALRFLSQQLHLLRLLRLQIWKHLLWFLTRQFHLQALSFQTWKWHPQILRFQTWKLHLQILSFLTQHLDLQARRLRTRELNLKIFRELGTVKVVASTSTNCLWNLTSNLRGIATTGLIGRTCVMTYPISGSECQFRCRSQTPWRAFSSHRVRGSAPSSSLWRFPFTSG